MNHNRDQGTSRLSNPTSRAFGPAPSSAPNRPSSATSMMRNIRTVNMTEPRQTLNAPTSNGAGGVAVNITVANDHRTEMHHDTATPPLDVSLIHGTPRADHEIYYHQLLTKKRGSPLWVPGPATQLPIEYQKQGISIGDVGIITQLGRFDFLFNIFQPTDGVINNRRVPDSFSNLDLEQLEPDITTGSIFGRNTYLTSSSVRTLGINSSDLTFESTAQEAAILTMPEGATTQDLMNKRIIQSCIEQNARSWYEYATGPRGRIIQQGEILGVVVGWDKVCSWGIATSTCTRGQSVSLQFKVDDESGLGTSQAYRWDCTGTACVRVGPQEEEISNLRQESGTAPLNQCVFVRTMNFTLGGAISEDSPLTAVQDVPVSVKGNHRGSASTHRGLKGRSKGQRSSGRTGSSARQVSSAYGGLHTRQLVTFNCMESGIVHPSSWLHEHLLTKHPNATMIITQDADWISVLTDEDINFPGAEELCARILESHDIHENDGIVTIEKKIDPYKSDDTTHNHTQIQTPGSFNHEAEEEHASDQVILQALPKGTAGCSSGWNSTQAPHTDLPRSGPQKLVLPVEQETLTTSPAPGSPLAETTTEITLDLGKTLPSYVESELEALLQRLSDDKSTKGDEAFFEELALLTGNKLGREVSLKELKQMMTKGALPEELPKITPRDSDDLAAAAKTQLNLEAYRIPPMGSRKCQGVFTMGDANYEAFDSSLEPENVNCLEFPKRRGKWRKAKTMEDSPPLDRLPVPPYSYSPWNLSGPLCPKPTPFTMQSRASLSTTSLQISKSDDNDRCEYNITVL